jgi:hypothetical protein
VCGSGGDVVGKLGMCVHSSVGDTMAKLGIGGFILLS